MPVATRFEGRVLRLVPTGEYAWSDLLNALRTAMRQTAFAPGKTVLLFDSRQTSQARSSEELRDIAADLAPLGAQFAAVLIVASDDLRFGLARMLAAYAEHLGAEILVFRSMDGADAWLRAHAAERLPRRTPD